MCSAETPAATRAAALAARLTTATGGAEPRLHTDGTRIRIEADLPDGLAPGTHAAILDVLATGARYGHRRTGLGDLVWVEIDIDIDVVED